MNFSYLARSFAGNVGSVCSHALRNSPSSIEALMADHNSFFVVFRPEKHRAASFDEMYSRTPPNTAALSVYFCTSEAVSVSPEGRTISE